MNQGILSMNPAARWGQEAYALPVRTLSDLLRSDAGDTRRLLEESGLHAYYSYPTLALLEIDAGEADFWSRQYTASKLYEAIKRHAPSNCAVLPDDLSHIGIIFSWDDRESITRLYNTIRTHDIGLSTRTAALGISNPHLHLHLSDLRICYDQALFAVKHQFYQDDSQAIYFSRIQEYAIAADYPEDKEEELLRILTGERTSASIEQAVDEFYEQLLYKGPLPAQKVNDATLHLLVSLQLRVRSALNQASVSAAKPEMAALIQLPTLRELKLSVCQALRQLEVTACSSEILNHTVIKKAVTLMEDEFDKVSLDYVAKKVFITPAYLSTLFKSNMGVTFIEYLTRIRITHAKRLLKQTHLKNYEVAEKVGYNDSRYFSQIFKKKVGLSPSEFRDAR